MRKGSRRVHLAAAGFRDRNRTVMLRPSTRSRYRPEVCPHARRCRPSSCSPLAVAGCKKQEPAHRRQAGSRGRRPRPQRAAQRPRSRARSSSGSMPPPYSYLKLQTAAGRGLGRRSPRPSRERHRRRRREPHADGRLRVEDPEPQVRRRLLRHARPARAAEAARPAPRSAARGGTGARRGQGARAHGRARTRPRRPAATSATSRSRRRPAQDARTVAEVYAQRAALKDKTVTVRGKVVKSNAGIMGKNWIHLRDGTGHRREGQRRHRHDAGPRRQVATWSSSGARSRVDQDFGAGSRTLIIGDQSEDAKVSR